MSWLDSITDSMDMKLSKFQEIGKDRELGVLHSMGSQIVRHDLATEQLLLVAQTVKNASAMQETWAQSLGWEDPLEKGKATHSSILAWRIPGDNIVHGVTKSRTQLSDFHFTTLLKH